MTQLLCANMRYTRGINRYGILKMTKNTKSIQQNLTNIVGTHESRLDRALQYFELYNLGAEVTHQMFS